MVPIIFHNAVTLMSGNNRVLYVTLYRHRGLFENHPYYNPSQSFCMVLLAVFECVHMLHIYCMRVNMAGCF